MKVFHARINESITQYKATEMGKAGISPVTFRTRLQGNEELKKMKDAKEKA